MSQPTPLDRAIEIAGGITKLARELALASHSVVDQWRRNRVPAEHCPRIEEVTGIRCEELRPDVRWGVLRQKPKRRSKSTQQVGG